MNFYQACYGKPDGINWKVFNNTIPDNLDSQKNMFAKAASYCGPDMIRGVLGGKLPEDLYEIIILRETACVFRAKYWNAAAETEKTQETRDVMFAHGFVFNTKDIVLHPEDLLSVSDENFKFTVEETAVQPESLIRDNPLTPETAMSAAGLTKATWNTLMACVYAQRDSRSEAPLYIQCADRTQMKALIYCILTALPKQLRYSFAFSNENSVSGTMFGEEVRGEIVQPQRIFFTQNVPAHATVFEPESGYTNADIQDIQTGRAVYPAYNIFREESAGTFEEYCSLLDEVFAELKLPERASLNEVELAGLFVEGEDAIENKNERDSWKYLLNLMRRLREYRIQTVYTDDYIANVLEIFDRQNYNPNDTIMGYISALNDHTASPRLKEVYKKLQMRVLMNSGKEAIDAFLEEEYSKEKDGFHEWCSRIETIEGGTDCIKEFYVKLLENAKDYESIDDVYQDGLLRIKDGTWNPMVLRKYYNTAGRKIRSEYLQTVNFKEEFRRLAEALTTSYGDPEEKYYTVVKDKIVKQFWSDFSAEHFDFTEQCIKNCLEMKNGAASQVDPLLDIYDLVMRVKMREEDAGSVFGKIRSYRDRISGFSRESQFSAKEEELIDAKLQTFCAKELRSSCGSKMFTGWLWLARLTGEKNPIVNMYRWKLPVICDPDLFEVLFSSDEELQSMYYDLKAWISGGDASDGAIRILADDPDAVKTLKSEAKVISDYEKLQIALAKQQEKELRNQEKELRNLEKKTNKKLTAENAFGYEEPQESSEEKKGILGGLRDIFGSRKKNKL